jgi:uncharacterized protein
MRSVTLEMIFKHPITQHYLRRSGIAHAVKVAEYAYSLSIEHHVDPDLATKAALLHDIGHYTWYRNGEWDFELYKENDIHAIKGASRAHKLLIRIGEDPKVAKQIALAILLHTDSYLPDGHLHLNPLQKVVALADESDEEPKGHHHYKTMDFQTALTRLRQLDQCIDGHSSIASGGA